MSGNPHNPGEIVVTIKYGKGYDDSWLVFHGESQAAVRALLRDTFGADDEGLTLHELVLNCTKIAHGGSAVSTIGTAIPKSDTSAPAGDKPDPWKQAEEQASEPGPNPLIAKVEETETVQALQRVWAENKAEFDADAELMAAYKAHGKKLQAEQQAGV